MKRKLPVRYNDQVMRILLCVIAAFLVAMYGTGARFLDSLSNNSFFVKLLAAFLMAFLFIEFIHWVTVQLDKKYDWKDSPLLRLTLQFTLGVLLPGVVDYFFLSLYQWYFGLTTSSANPGLNNSIPAMALPVFLFNIYYLFYYQILRNREGNTYTKTEMEILLVQQGTKTIPMELQNIRFIYHQDRMNYLVTSNQTTYFINETLDELEQKLPPRDFFRINRKMIIQYRSCQDFRSNGHGKLFVHLSPSFHEEVTVSQSRAGKFKEWIRR
ncbi:LytTR family transcriptional regulator [Algoriphagus sp. AGSA1]|uniref:LytR/AlgR family response regulator transcription factor n=1 Tax=unclassified Algoriphagus TaxID=2641541 RepID=UPI0017840D4A|nr:LytTR family DNA-binding domain-containing protein [Algoriphagus sp. Y33]MCE7057592.1 LytTR family transcriptional regulator [Algoriphagus sp. AGSA1]